MKLKGLNFKKLLLDHGEKIGLAVIGLIVLVGLVGADWIPYSGYPQEITSKVAEGKQTFANWTWPDSEREQFVLSQKQMPKNVVYEHLDKSFNIAEYAFSTPKFVRTPYDQKEPLREPKWERLEDPLANQGRVLLAVVDPEAEKRFEEWQKKNPGVDPSNPDDENVPEEFRTRNQGSPYGGGLGGLGGPLGASGRDPYAGVDLAAMGRMGAARGAQSGTTGGGARGNRARARGGDKGSGDASDMELLMGAGGGGYGMAMGPTQAGRGFHYVSVRAVFPVRSQIMQIAKATNLQMPVAAQTFEILDYEIERQTMKQTGEPWSGPWEPVDINVTRDVLEKISINFEPDVVASQVTDPAITMPLPMRLMGIWQSDATHPRIEKFTLTDEQVQQERELNELLIQELEEQQKQLPPAPALKGGWSNLSGNANSIRSAALGGSGAAYEGLGGAGPMGFSAMGGMGGMASMPGIGGASGPGGRRGGAGGHGGGSQRGGAAGGHGGGSGPMASMPMPAGSRPGAGAGAQKDLVEELLKKAPKERKEALEKYIIDVASVQGELLLFRYIDFSVVPGNTYRYRIRLTFRNPNFDRNHAEAANDVTVVEGETRKSDWSEPTNPTTVEKNQTYYVADVKTSPGKAFPVPRLNIFQWDTSLGTIQQAVLDVALGQTVGGKAKTKVLDPAKNSFEEKNYTFQSTDFAVGALPDISLEAGAHPGITPLGGRTQGDLKLNEQILIATSEGGLKLLDPSEMTEDEKRQSKNLEYQNRSYEQLLEQSKAGSPLAGELSEMSGMGSMYGSMPMMQRGVSPLSKKGRGGMGSMGSMGPMGSGGQRSFSPPKSGSR